MHIRLKSAMFIIICFSILIAPRHAHGANKINFFGFNPVNPQQKSLQSPIFDYYAAYFDGLHSKNDLQIILDDRLKTEPKDETSYYGVSSKPIIKMMLLDKVRKSSCKDFEPLLQQILTSVSGLYNPYDTLIRDPILIRRINTCDLSTYSDFTKDLIIQYAVHVYFDTNYRNLSVQPSDNFIEFLFDTSFDKKFKYASNGIQFLATFIEQNMNCDEKAIKKIRSVLDTMDENSNFNILFPLIIELKSDQMQHILIDNMRKSPKFLSDVLFYFQQSNTPFYNDDLLAFFQEQLKHDHDLETRTAIMKTISNLTTVRDNSILFIQYLKSNDKEKNKDYTSLMQCNLMTVHAGLDYYASSDKTTKRDIMNSFLSKCAWEGWHMIYPALVDAIKNDDSTSPISPLAQMDNGYDTLSLIRDFGKKHTDRKSNEYVFDVIGRYPPDDQIKVLMEMDKHQIMDNIDRLISSMPMSDDCNVMKRYDDFLASIMTTDLSYKFNELRIIDLKQQQLRTKCGIDTETMKIALADPHCGYCADRSILFWLRDNPIEEYKQTVIDSLPVALKNASSEDKGYLAEYFFNLGDSDNITYIHQIYDSITETQARNSLKYSRFTLRDTVRDMLLSMGDTSIIPGIVSELRQNPIPGIAKVDTLVRIIARSCSVDALNYLMALGDSYPEEHQTASSIRLKAFTGACSLRRPESG